MENDKDGKQKYIEESINSNMEDSEENDFVTEVTLDVYSGNGSKIRDIMELLGTSKKNTFNILIRYGSSYLNYANLQEYEIEKISGQKTDAKVEVDITKKTEDRINNMGERHDASSALNIAAALFYSDLSIEKIKTDNGQ